jgi:hypothetical protein
MIERYAHADERGYLHIVVFVMINLLEEVIE